jgi:hypothetical protein
MAKAAGNSESLDPQPPRCRRLYPIENGLPPGVERYTTYRDMFFPLCAWLQMKPTKTSSIFFEITALYQMCSTFSLGGSLTFMAIEYYDGSSHDQD